jgi:tetratricopeptide (TPR) repeat protein
MRLKFVLALFFTFLWLLPTGAQENLYLEGIASFQQRNFPQAVQSFTEVLKASPENLDALQKRGEAFFGMDDYDEALSDFRSVNSIKSNFSSLWISKCYAEKGETTKALEALADHLNSPYKLTKKEILLDPSFQRIENTREWRSFWKKDWYKPYENEKAEADFLIRQEKPDEAIEKLNVLLNQKDDDASLYFLRSKAYVQLRMYNKSLADLNLAVSKAPAENIYREERIGLYMKMKRDEDALNDYAEMIKASPGDFELYLKRAGLLLKMHDYRYAMRDVNTYLGYFEEDEKALYLGGRISYESGEYYDAVKYFNRALKQDQTKDIYFIARADTYVKMHTWEYAANDYSMALDLNPDNPEVYLSRGIVHLKENQNKKACYDFEKAFKMGEKKALDYLQKHCDF